MTDQQEPPPRGGPITPRTPDTVSRRTPPDSVRAAVVLWICAAIIGLATSALMMGASNSASSSNAMGPMVCFAAAIAVLAFANRLRWGIENSRGWLTGLGVALMLGVITIPVVIAALILQYLPRSSAWYRAVNAPPGPLPPLPSVPPPPPPPDT